MPPRTKPRKKSIDRFDDTVAPLPVPVRDVRNHLKETEQIFWNRIGISQSGGSRYECGRVPPKSVNKLLRLTYGATVNKLLRRSRKTRAKKK